MTVQKLVKLQMFNYSSTFDQVKKVPTRGLKIHKTYVLFGLVYNTHIHMLYTDTGRGEGGRNIFTR